MSLNLPNLICNTPHIWQYAWNWWSEMNTNSRATTGKSPGILWSGSKWLHISWPLSYYQSLLNRYLHLLPSLNFIIAFSTSILLQLCYTSTRSWSWSNSISLSLEQFYTGLPCTYVYNESMTNNYNGQRTEPWWTHALHWQNRDRTFPLC